MIDRSRLTLQFRTFIKNFDRRMTVTDIANWRQDHIISCSGYCSDKTRVKNKKLRAKLTRTRIHVKYFNFGLRIWSNKDLGLKWSSELSRILDGSAVRQISAWAWTWIIGTVVKYLKEEITTAWIFHHRQERPDFTDQRLSASVKTCELRRCRVDFLLVPREWERNNTPAWC